MAHILIVDDDENIAELISLYLTKECYDTMIVHDGEEALNACKTFRPNLILLDFNKIYNNYFVNNRLILKTRHVKPPNRVWITKTRQGFPAL